MKAARMKLQARQQACLQRAMVEWRAIRNKSQSRIARRRTALSMHSPHVHSPCAQPLDDGWLLHVKMLHLLAGFEGECKAAHRVRRGSWRRVLAGVVFSLASCKSALAARSLVRGFFRPAGRRCHSSSALDRVRSLHHIIGSVLQSRY